LAHKTLRGSEFEEPLVTEERLARPALATFLCFYEIGIVLLALATPMLLHHPGPPHPVAHHPAPHPVAFVQTAASVLSYALAVCAAVLLWRMHRAASYLLAGRALIALVRYVVVFVRPLPFPLATHLGHSRLALILWVGRGIGMAVVLLSASIAWYVYDITAPRGRRPIEPSVLAR
jgi:hypothetical protein